LTGGTRTRCSGWLALEGPGACTAAQALDLLAQGYRVARVAEVTGFDHRWVRFQAARMAHTDRADTGGAPVDDAAEGDGGIDGPAGGDR